MEQQLPQLAKKSNRKEKSNDLTSTPPPVSCDWKRVGDGTIALYRRTHLYLSKRGVALLDSSRISLRRSKEQQTKHSSTSQKSTLETLHEAQKGDIEARQTAVGQMVQPTNREAMAKVRRKMAWKLKRDAFQPTHPQRTAPGPRRDSSTRPGKRDRKNLVNSNVSNKPYVGSGVSRQLKRVVRNAACSNHLRKLLEQENSNTRLEEGGHVAPRTWVVTLPRRPQPSHRRQAPDSPI